MHVDQLAEFAWTFDIVHPDADRRRAAIERERGYQNEWARHHTWVRIARQRVAERDGATPRLQAEYDQVHAAMRDAYDRMFAAPIWHYLSGAAAAEELAPFARHAVLYLRWETEYPDEWASLGKSWAAKRHILRTLATQGPTPETHGDLLALVGAAVRREHRCEDLGYVKLARALHQPSVRMIVEWAEDDLDGLVRLRAGYLRWALDHPGAPVTAASWHAWLRA
ncbi:hypothetical protein [Catellatospora sp. NPDC049609]|uniref:hypothetical protein n=1 Tax=Catellatospora sp. NPDC049609 TaxID=3155505 RepID=UPI003429A7B5